MANYTATTDMTLEEAITNGSMADGENLTITSGAVVTCTQTPSVLIGSLWVQDGEFIIDGQNISSDNLINFVGEYQQTFRFDGRGTLTVDGDWYSLGSTDGTNSQTFSLSSYYNNTSFGGAFCVDCIPMIEVETGRRIYFDNTVGVLPEIGDMLVKSSDDNVIGRIVEVQSTYLIVRYLTGSLSDNDDILVRKVIDRSGPSLEISWTGKVNNVSGDIKEVGIYQQFGNTRSNGTSYIADFHHGVGGFVFDNAFQSTTLTMGSAAGSTGGFVAPSGCNVRIPNVHFCTSNTTNYAIGTTYHDGTASETNWYSLNTTLGGEINVSICNFGISLFRSENAYSFESSHTGSFISIGQATCGSRLSITDATVCDDPILAAIDITVFGVDLINGGDYTRCNFISSCSSSRSLGSANSNSCSYSDCIISISGSWYLSTAYHLNFSNCTNITVDKLIIVCGDNAAISRSPVYMINVTGCDLSDFILSMSQDGTNSTKSAGSMTLVNCQDMTIKGLEFLNNSISGGNAFSITNSRNIKIRAIGSLDKKIDMGTESSRIVFVQDTCVDIDCARIWFDGGTFVNGYPLAATTRNIYFKNYSYKYNSNLTPNGLDNIIMTGGHCGDVLVGDITIGAVGGARYGRQFYDAFRSDTLGFIAFIALAPSSSINNVTIIAGDPFFTRGGSLEMANGDIIEIDQDYYSLGHVAFNGDFTTAIDDAPHGTDEWGSADIYFQYDIGSGWNGSWLDVRTPANLIGISSSHTIEVDNISGTFNVGDSISWGAAATAGTGLVHLLAGTTLEFILSSGVVPINDLTITDSNTSATCDADGSASSNSSCVDGVKFKLRIEATASISQMTAMTIDSTTSTEDQLNNLHPIDQDYVTVSCMVKDASSLTVIEDARILLVAGPGGDLAEGTVILSDLTNSSGVLETTSFLYTSDQPVTGRIRKSSPGDSLYKTQRIEGTITSNGLSIVSLMVSDS